MHHDVASVRVILVNATTSNANIVYDIDPIPHGRQCSQDPLGISVDILVPIRMELVCICKHLTPSKSKKDEQYQD